MGKKRQLSPAKHRLTLTTNRPLIRWNTQHVERVESAFIHTETAATWCSDMLSVRKRGWGYQSSHSGKLHVCTVEELWRQRWSTCPYGIWKKQNSKCCCRSLGVEEVGGLLAWSHLKRIINTAGFNVGILLVTPGAGFIWNNKKVLLLPSTVSVSFTNPHSDFCTHWHANYNLNSRCSIFLESQFTLVLPCVTHDTVQSAWEEGKHNYFPSKCFPAGSSSKDENITSPKHCYR